MAKQEQTSRKDSLMTELSIGMLGAIALPGFLVKYGGLTFPQAFFYFWLPISWYWHSCVHR